MSEPELQDSSSSVRLLEGVGPSVGDTTSMNNENDVDMSSLGGWVPDVAITGLLALLLLSESKKLFCNIINQMDDSQGLKSPEKKVKDSPKFKSPLENDSDSDWKVEAS
ncbi:hypothetical protein Tco_0724960 [Tanacetum coccineum]|uniref:Uncharacterized protein n=1 Tax=Tanacetum coccineum TaxID=301880 RepID=A0ABQ4YBJ6_9ASTR